MQATTRQALNRKNALVLFSGGQDSAIALAWALGRYERVETIGFDYGQRHAVELAARARLRQEFGRVFPVWKERLGEDFVVDLGGFGDLSETSLTRETPIQIGDNGLPTTFVPGRNLLFLVMAGALAYRRDTGELVAGMCETDFSGYPDCREEALAAQIAAMKLGMDADFTLQTPLMYASKAQGWQMANELGGAVLVNIINEHSHSCYRGTRTMRHRWGYGCGACPACDLRAKGWDAYTGAISYRLTNA